MRNSKLIFAVLCLAFGLWLSALPVLADDGGRTAIFGEDYTLEPGKRLDHDLLVFGGRVHLQRDSVVEGDVIITGGQATLEGQVNGDVLILGGTVELAATAVIEKDLVVLGQLQRDHDATVKGNIVEGWQASKALPSLPEVLSVPRLVRPVSPVRPAPGPARPSQRDVSGRFGKLLADLASVVAIVVIAALLIALAPDNLRRITHTMEHYMAFSLGVGILTILVVVVASTILTITLIGIPLVIVLGLGLLLSALVAWAAAGQVVGQRVLRALHAKGQSPLVEVLVGILLITFLARVPCIGWLFGLLALSWGLGAVTLTRLGTRPYPPLAPFVDPTATAPSTPPPAEAGPAAPASAPRRGDTRPLNERILEEAKPSEE